MSVRTDGTAVSVPVTFSNGTTRGFLTVKAAIRYADKRGLTITAVRGQAVSR